MNVLWRRHGREKSRAGRGSCRIGRRPLFFSYLFHHVELLHDLLRRLVVLHVADVVGDGGQGRHRPGGPGALALGAAGGVGVFHRECERRERVRAFLSLSPVITHAFPRLPSLPRVRARPRGGCMLLRWTATSAAHRCLLLKRGRGRDLLLPPTAQRAMGDDASTTELAAAKAALRREVKAKLKAVPDEVLAEECEWIDVLRRQTQELDLSTLLPTRASSHTRTLPLHPLSQSHHTAAAIASHILASPLWSASTRVGAYVAAPRLREVETAALLEAALEEGGGSSAPSSSPAKRLFVPVVDDKAAGMRLLHLGEIRYAGVNVRTPFFLFCFPS